MSHRTTEVGVGSFWNAKDAATGTQKMQRVFPGIEKARPLNASKFMFSKLTLNLERRPLVIGKVGWKVGVFSNIIARAMGIPKPLRTLP